MWKKPAGYIVGCAVALKAPWSASGRAPENPSGELIGEMPLVIHGSSLVRHGVAGQSREESGLHEQVLPRLLAAQHDFRLGNRSGNTDGGQPDGEVVDRAVVRNTLPTVERSSARSAWQREPPIVPRLRTVESAITPSASPTIGNRREMSGDSSRVTWRVIAPTLSVLPSRRRSPARKGR